MDGSRIILAAHRGDKFNFPENTMPAFKSACDLGVDMIETDIRMTKDGELVLFHDRSALRTTGVDVNIEDLTLAELKELDAGATFSKPIKAQVPTVREFLEFIKGTDMLVNWEFKVYPTEFGEETAFGVVDKLVDMLKEYDMLEKSMLNSFSIKVLEYIYKKYGKTFSVHGQGIYNCKRWREEAEIDATEYFDWCCLYPSQKDYRALDFKENFDYCVEHGIHPCLCIPDDLEDYKKAIDWGCKMFTSNNIGEAAEILTKLNVR